MPCDFNGVWKHDKTENFDAFLDALGVNAAKRKIAAAITPVMEITQDGDKFVVNASGGPGGATKLEFTIGQEFESEMFGHKMKNKPSWDGNKLKMIMTPLGDLKGPIVITRVVQGDELNQRMEVGNVICTRIFKKQ
ncbi:retinol-binding protein 1-like [Lingula anatina]|uniref:Retinol-binding protein 1-like n=1 Tax=Lingula anatina TaxID=7574 RepID=A0A1S3HX47_LINAN|nr:retinol-binding protein 1-like [Lingula anatina]|eukprot:XP_013389639.1 retinol-binding protein 1-like [Lingula anatina]